MRRGNSANAPRSVHQYGRPRNASGVHGRQLKVVTHY